MSSLTPRIDKLDRNYVINGGFDYWQRGTSISSSNSFGPDRFLYASSGTTYDLTRQTDVPSTSSSLYSGRFARTLAGVSITSTTFSVLRHSIEGLFFRSLKSKDITLSFWVKANNTGTYGISFRNAAVSRCYVTSYTVNAANTWEQKIINFTHDASGAWQYDNAVGLDIVWTLTAGTNYQTNILNQWQDGNLVAPTNQTQISAIGSGAFLQLSDVMLYETGTVADIQGFILAGRNVIDELALCQRYYELWTGRVRAALQSGTNEYPIGMKVTKRATPTVTITGDGGSAVNISVNGFSYSTTSASSGNISIAIDAELS